MKIYSEISLENFEAWSGAVNTLDRIRNAGKCDELEAMLEELYPDGMTSTELNDLLWFEPEQVYEWCGIRTESEIRSELEEARERLEELKQNYADECESLDEDDDLAEYWTVNYADDAAELEEKISELEEELENY